MKKSKNFFCKINNIILKKIFKDKFYSLLLFIRNYKKFKRELIKKND